MAQYEVEIKVLLGTKSKVAEFLKELEKNTRKLEEKGTHKQLNHYFHEGDINTLVERISPYVSSQQLIDLESIIRKASDFSVRTRWADGRVYAVIKASADTTTSSNGIARFEWEAQVNCTIEELDTIILEANFTYQAKWSRERTDYSATTLDDETVNVSIDKNAGYGFLAELEYITSDADRLDDTKKLLRNLLEKINFHELPQDRLARMFAYYNANWQEYYGTDKVFNVE